MDLKKHRFATFCLVIAGLILFVGFNSAKNNQNESKETKKFAFQKYPIADSLENFWAMCPADLTGDKTDDLAFIYNNAFGGYLGYFIGRKDTSLWKKTIIAKKAPNGGTFAAGDLECADIDFDGDIDIIAVQHTGEWENAKGKSVIYWYENPGWKAHLIGEAPNFVKDLSYADFNNDSKMDLAVLTFEDHTLSVFQQNDKDNWERVQYFHNYKDIHEGMDVGDLNGDGNTDIVANAYAFFNPGNDLSAQWKVENINEKWNSQEGDWSRNATKIYLKDINHDKNAEVFISHSERVGYPLAWYQRNANGTWDEKIIKDSIHACHTLQVFDFNKDGAFDVLAGINKGRAKDLNKSDFDVTVFLGNKSHNSWKPVVIDENGIYNGQVSDFDKDGDYDIFCYPAHNSVKLYMLSNITNGD